LKLPTGDADQMTVSDSVDVTALIASDYELSDRWSVFGQAAVTWMSEGARFVSQQRDWAWSAMAGVNAQLFEQLTLTAQVDAHSAVFDTTGLEFLGRAVMLSVGGTYEFVSGWSLDLGVSEDIEVESAPDVVFLFGLKKTF
jgi:Protein of unknown function (DUF3187)